MQQQLLYAQLAGFVPQHTPSAPAPPLPPLQDEYIPWGTLRYLIGEAMYGGRVSDSFDRRILTTYLDEYLGDFLFDTFQVSDANQ
jgi:hypothetical protein